MEYKDLKKFYRDHWFENVKANESEQNQAYFVKKYGYKYFSENCRGCGKQGHKAMDCPDKKPVQDYAQAWKPRPD
jgi:hypothetical protein